MRAVLLDTSAYIALRKGLPEAEGVIRSHRRLGVTSVVVGELLCGIALSQDAATMRSELSAFLNYPNVLVFPVTANTAVHYGRIFAALRRKGRPIPSNDMWVAASALEHDLALYSYDTHFEHVPGLVRLQP
jgi:tRNA(fMet)-specific endonuclease VapC